MKYLRDKYKKDPLPDVHEGIYSDFLESIPDPAVIVQDDVCISVNSAFCAHFGYTRDDLLDGFDFINTVQKNDLEAVVLAHKNGINDRTIQKKHRIDIITKNGKIIPCEISSSGISYMNDKAVMLIIRDITSRFNTEKELIKFKFISDNILDACFIADGKGEFKYVNKSFCTLLGYSEEELLSSGLSDIDRRYDDARYRQLFDDICHSMVSNFKITSRRKDGSVVLSEITAMGFKIDRAVHMFATLRDITRPKHEEETVNIIAKGVSSIVGENIFTSLAQDLANTLGAPYAYIAELDPEKPDYARTLSLIEDGTIIDNIEVNLSGTPCETVIDKNICSYASNVTELFPDAHMIAAMNVKGYVGKLLYSSDRRNLGLMAVMYREPVENVRLIESTLVIYAARAASELERRLYEKALKEANEELEARVHERTLELKSANEQLNEKIVKLEATKNALHASEKRFRAAATSTADLIWEGNVRSGSLHWFGDIDGMLGYEVGVLPRTIAGFMDYIHPDDRNGLVQSLEKSLQSGNNFRTGYRIRSRDGTYRYWIQTGMPTDIEQGKPVKWVGSVTDITERKKAEKKLIESEGRYKGLSQEFNALLNGIPDNLILLSPDLKILWSNKAFAVAVGKNISEIQGRHCYQMCSHITRPCKKCPALKCFRSGKEETSRVINKNGNIFDKRVFPIMDESGEVKNVIEVSRDITTEVHREEEAKLIQTRLIQANKMTSLGTLVSGVAHEINNPNSFIMNNAQVFAEIWEDAVTVLAHTYCRNKGLRLAGIPFLELKKIAPKLIDGIKDGSLRISDIVNNLRNFSRPDKARLEGKVDINKVIMTSLSMIENQIKKYTNNFHVTFGKNLPIVRGSAQQIEQVVVNLILNALQSLPDKISGVWVSSRHNRKTNTLDFKVRDGGVGILKDSLDRVTEPFFTTKLDSGGTGLGLSISYSIVRDHQGSLTIKSREGKGTVVVVKLPLY